MLKPVILQQPFTQATGTNHALGDTANEVDYFYLLLTDDMLEMIVVQTNVYALKMNISLVNLPSTLISFDYI